MEGNPATIYLPFPAKRTGRSEGRGKVLMAEVTLHESAPDNIEDEEGEGEEAVAEEGEDDEEEDADKEEEPATKKWMNDVTEYVYLYFFSISFH